MKFNKLRLDLLVYFPSKMRHEFVKQIVTDVSTHVSPVGQGSLVAQPHQHT